MYTKAYISTLGIVRVHFQTSFVTLLTLVCSIMYTDKNLWSLRAIPYQSFRDSNLVRCLSSVTSCKMRPIIFLDLHNSYVSWAVCTSMLWDHPITGPQCLYRTIIFTDDWTESGIQEDMARKCFVKIFVKNIFFVKHIVLYFYLHFRESENKYLRKFGKNWILLQP